MSVIRVLFFFNATQCSLIMASSSTVCSCFLLVLYTFLIMQSALVLGHKSRQKQCAFCTSSLINGGHAIGNNKSITLYKSWVIYSHPMYDKLCLRCHQLDVLSMNQNQIPSLIRISIYDFKNPMTQRLHVNATAIMILLSKANESLSTELELQKHQQPTITFANSTDDRIKGL